MRWKLQCEREWRSDDGYTIEHARYGLGMYYVNFRGTNVGGTGDLASAKRMAERHQLEQQVRAAVPTATRLALKTTAELREMLASRKGA